MMGLDTLQLILLVVHTLVAISIIVFVLMQADKGEGLSGAFGGGAAQTMFGAKGSLDFFGKMTTILAIIFILTSITLTYISSRDYGTSPSINPNDAQQQDA
ncbi:MAG: preprotein translocase subunit SecG [Candidatus Muiribacteriota bacterium]